MPGLIRAVGRTAVVAGTATAVSNRVSRRQAGRWADQEQQQQQQAYEQQQAYAPPPQAAAAPADDSADRLEQLKQLGDLKAQGVLTEAEFQAEKNKILYA
jgi:hypothetical protein